MTATPPVVDRETWQQQVDELLVREKAHTREGDAIAAARRRLPMVELDAATPLVGADGDVTLLDVFEGRRQLITYFHMWHAGHTAPDQCEGCSFFNGHVRELSYLHSRDVTYATITHGPWSEVARYRDFLGLEAPWYTAPELYEELGDSGIKVFLRDGDRVFQTYEITGRGCEIMSNSYGLLDLTVYGRQEVWEDSPEGWPQDLGTRGEQFRLNGRPTLQWSRLEAGRSDDLGATGPAGDHHCH
ncbi:DUF899 family protein [Nocardioides cheoyonin]|uniref:DUF899 family protein n=1 Tax=Nocardioides cheoyonin TaxID=3156615 RepID=UPI0032B46A0F